MKYLTFISHTYATKNALEIDVFKLIKSYDRTTISDDKLLLFVTRINEHIDALNKKHKRCAPMFLTLHKSNAYTKYPDYIISWNDLAGYNGHELCCFQFLFQRSELTDEEEEFTP